MRRVIVVVVVVVVVVVGLTLLTHIYNTMQFVVTGQAPVTLERYLRRKTNKKQKITTP